MQVNEPRELFGSILSTVGGLIGGQKDKPAPAAAFSPPINVTLQQPAAAPARFDPKWIIYGAIVLVGVVVILKR